MGAEVLSSSRGAALCIGITGGSGVGKSTFAALLVTQLADLQPAVLHQDRYFRDWSEFPEAEREAKRTANHPDALLWPAFLTQFAALRRGEPADEPAAGTRRQERSGIGGVISPSPVLIVEGLFALWQAELRAQLDLRIFLEAPDDERLLRRLLRDVVQRGGDLERAAAWYRRDVLPNYADVTGASRRYAHLIVPWLETNEVAVSAVSDWIRGELRRREHHGVGME